MEISNEYCDFITKQLIRLIPSKKDRFPHKKLFSKAFTQYIQKLSNLTKKIIMLPTLVIF